uniref:Uncharacterized protein n=1 Tax=Acrobeloides nanus TaxID=290746 RepID=A0A914DZ12_9BILA
MNLSSLSSTLDPVEMLATARAAELNGYSLGQVQAFLAQNGQFLASIPNPKSVPSSGDHSQPNSVASVGSVGSVGSNFSTASQHGIDAENANATTPPLLLPWGNNPYMPMVVLSMPSTSQVASNLVNVLANSPMRNRFSSLSENIQPDIKTNANMLQAMANNIDMSAIGISNPRHEHDASSKKSPVSKAFNAQNPLKTIESTTSQARAKRKSDGSFSIQKHSPPQPQQQQQPPSTSANFTVPTSQELNSPNYRGLPAVPRCSICGADSTGIHFGVEACAACSAFFRRTVVLNKNYVCSKEGNCSFNKDSPTGQKCRSCRFKKCLDVGMDKNAVQHRRDAIGKYSNMVKRECASPPAAEYDVHVPGCSTSSCDRTFTPPSPKSPRVQTSVLSEILERYDALNKRRRMFYCNSSIHALFEPNGEMEPVELTNFGDCMFQLWRIEPRLCVEFISNNRYLAPLSSTEKTKILSSFMLIFQAVEEPYITWQYGGMEKKFWMMANRTYIDYESPEKYFEKNSNIMKDLNLDKTSAVNLFKPSFVNAMETIGARMAELNITKSELVVLIALVLLDPTNPLLEPTTVELLHSLRNQLFKDLMNFYEADDNIEDPEVRMGNLILIMSGIKVHAQKSQENMQLLKVFDVIPRDQLFDEVTGIAATS